MRKYLEKPLKASCAIRIRIWELFATITSLKLDLQQKNITIDELNNEIDLIKIESFDKAEKPLESERKNKELSDSFDALLVGKNTLHDENLNLNSEIIPKLLRTLNQKLLAF